MPSNHSTSRLGRSIEDKLFARFARHDCNQLIPLLDALQQHYGYLPQKTLERVGEYFGLSSSDVYNLARRFRRFRFRPKGRFHIRVCCGTACHLKGSDAIAAELVRCLKIEPGWTTPDGLFSLEAVDCLGVCGFAPAVCINNWLHPHVRRDDVSALLAEYRRMISADEATMDPENSSANQPTPVQCRRNVVA